ncbi:hypothetical protein BGX28_000904 [Mortierella sp. GBA30]|nr:hypothetical protein BGX28_000904 [Mortierella sp. GBA30]
MFSSVRVKARTRALFVSYGKDWGLVIVVLALFSFIDTLEPFHRQFSVKDVTIQHPFAKKETVPIWMALVLAFILPGVIIACIALFKRRSYTDLHNGLLGLFLAEALVLIVTDSVKIAVGRPRPDFLDRCLSLYDNDAQGTPVHLLEDPFNMLSNSTICTRTELLKDGFKSFPSGHSSFSFGGLGYLSMYLAGKLHLFDERGHIYKSIVVLAPLILAALIAASRVANYRHHWQDVTVGAFIGALFAIFAYRQYYPSLALQKCDRPFAPRIRDEILPTTLTPHHHIHRQDEPMTEDEMHREAFLSNVGGNQGTGSRETLTGTDLRDMSGNNGAKYNNNSPAAPSFDHSRQGQSAQPRNDNYLGPLS